MNKAFLDLTKYVNAGADLAESIAKDIEHGNKITNETVLALSKFAIAARDVATMLDNIDSDENGTKLQ